MNIKFSGSQTSALPGKDHFLLKRQSVESLCASVSRFVCVLTISANNFHLCSVVIGGYDAMAAWSDIRPRMLWAIRWKSAHSGWIKNLMTGKIVAFRPRWPLCRDDHANARWKVKVILSSSFLDSCHQHRLCHQGQRHVITLLLALGRLHLSFKE